MSGFHSGCRNKKGLGCFSACIVDFDLASRLHLSCMRAEVTTLETSLLYFRANGFCVRTTSAHCAFIALLRGCAFLRSAMCCVALLSDANLHGPINLTSPK